MLVVLVVGLRHGIASYFGLRPANSRSTNFGEYPSSAASSASSVSERPQGGGERAALGQRRLDQGAGLVLAHGGGEQEGRALGVHGGIGRVHVGLYRVGVDRQARRDLGHRLDHAEPSASINAASVGHSACHPPSARSCSCRHRRDDGGEASIGARGAAARTSAAPMGLRLCGMVEEPPRPGPEGSEASPTSTCIISAMSRAALGQGADDQGRVLRQGRRPARAG